LSEALKRRCLHLYIPFPDQKLEREIVRIRVPDISEKLETQLVAFIHEVRKLDIRKVPSISESIDWARVLMILHVNQLNVDLIQDTLNTFVKFEEDVRLVKEQLRSMAEKAIQASHT
jgi:MoxR-like ATPase